METCGFSSEIFLLMLFSATLPLQQKGQPISTSSPAFHLADFSTDELDYIAELPFHHALPNFQPFHINHNNISQFSSCTFVLDRFSLHAPQTHEPDSVCTHMCSYGNTHTSFIHMYANTHMNSTHLHIHTKEPTQILIQIQTSIHPHPNSL